VWTLRKKAYEGDIALVKIGAKLLIPESEMERMVREGARLRRAAERRVRSNGAELARLQ
jgi:hypothetical protein